MSYSCTRAQALIWPSRSQTIRHTRPRSRSNQKEISNDKFNLCNELCERDDSEEISAVIVGTKVLLVYAFNCAFHQSWLPFKWHFPVSFQALFLPLSVFHFYRQQMIKWQLPGRKKSENEKRFMGDWQRFSWNVPKRWFTHSRSVQSDSRDWLTMICDCMLSAQSVSMRKIWHLNWT